MTIGPAHTRKTLRLDASAVRHIVLSLSAITSLFLVGSPSYAQEALRPPSLRLQDSLRVSSVDFGRVLNTFTWNGNIFFDREFNGVDVMFRQLLRSRLIRTDPLSTQDEYDDSLVVGTEVMEGWKARLQQVSSIVSDNRAIDLTKLGQHQVLLGVKVNASPGVSFGALAGYEIDAQQDELDKGFAYQADADAENVLLEEFR